MSEREFLIDVSRLIWRVWTGRLPTGIDRVCLAYLEHFGSRAQAVVHKGNFLRVLSPEQTDRLTTLLLSGGDGFRKGLVKMASRILWSGRGNGKCSGKIYLNIGHTGLDDPVLMRWIRNKKVRAVYLIHDLIPVSHPEFCREGEDEKHRQRMCNVLESAAGIIGNSRATLNELAAFASAQGRGMPPSVPAWISGYPIPEVLKPARMDRPYFVTVGTIEGRKNHILLFNLWLRLAEKLGAATPRLLVIGQRGWEAEHAHAMLDRSVPLRRHVHEMNGCSDEDMARLIAGSQALLMPSFAEGFGLPVVEALQLGVPVIASDLPVFREIAADIPHYLDPNDGAGWEQAILSFVGQSPERERQLAAMQGFRAPEWPQHFATVEPWLASLPE